MSKKQIKIFRMKMGKYLHNYYKKYGEKEYEKFLQSAAPIIKKDYGDSFTEENLRIMEAEYVVLNKKLGANDSKNYKK